MATAHGAGLMVVPVVLRLDHRPAVESNAIALPTAHIQSASLIETEAPATATGGMTTVSDVDSKADPPAIASKPDSTPSCHAQIGKMADRGGSGVLYALAGVGLHTFAMFLAMASIALVVFERIGLRILRTAWYNLDLVWAAALIGAGALTLVL
jgi:hypothetical protein